MPVDILIWLALLIICVILEAATLGLTTIWFAIGALAALIAALITANLAVQILLFLIISLVLLYFTRPIALKYLKIGHAKTNYETYIGKQGYVVEAIDTIRGKGQVKVDGLIWSARSSDNKTIELNTKVKVMDVKGVKLIVETIKENANE